MARRNDKRQTAQIKKQVEKATSNVLSVTAIIGLVACVLINALYKDSVPDVVFWIFGAAIVPDAIKFLRDGRS